MKNRLLRKKMFWLITGLALVITLCILTFRPIINPKEGDCDRISGVLKKYRYLESSKDVQMKLEGYDNVFYVNHLFEGELNFSDLDSLIGKPVVIYAVRHWTLSDPNSKFKHVARITDQDGTKIVYSEY